MMRLWIGVHLPSLPLESLRPRWCEPAPHVVLEQARVVAASAPAAAAGVRPGMRRGGVLSLCPQAVLHQREIPREQAALREAALAMLRYTPEVALAEESSLLLDVGASLSAFGGRRALCRQVGASIEALGFTARIGMAPTAQGAWLLARQGGRQRRAVRPAGMARRLDALSLAVLPAARPHADWLRGIGCLTLADLRRLPRAGLQRRCGPAVLAALDRAYGDAAELFDWVTAPPAFSARLELPDRVEQAEALSFAARRLLLQLCGWLAARQRAVTRYALLLEHERGRMALAPTVLEIALAEPAWREGQLLLLLKERLGRLALPAAVIALRLRARDTQPLAPGSETLFPEPGGTPADYRRLLELLTARLGAECVLAPAPVADHRPEVRNGWMPATAAASTATGAAPARPALADAGDRPFWLLPEPLALPLRGQRPFYGTPLTLVRGPERIESGWWDGAPALRDYFVAQSETAVFYWIYRQRSAEESGWFLHGLFG